jgi:hypothetical protein
VSDHLLTNIGTKYVEKGREQDTDYLVCLVVNDPEVTVGVPTALIEQSQKSSEISELIWPLGAHLIFKPTTITLGLYGRSNGTITHKGIVFNLADPTPVSLGSEVWGLWRRLKNVEDERLETHLKRFVHLSLLRHGPPFSQEERDFLQHEYLALAALIFQVPRHSISAEFFLLTEDNLSIELRINGEPIPQEHPLNLEVIRRFNRYLSSENVH